MRLKTGLEFAHDIEPFVAKTAPVISIPQDAPRCPPASWGAKSLPHQEIAFTLASGKFSAMLKATGELKVASDGRLARGTAGFHPLGLMTDQKNAAWQNITAVSIDWDGLLVVTVESGMTFRIRSDRGMTGSIEQVPK